MLSLQPIRLFVSSLTVLLNSQDEATGKRVMGMTSVPSIATKVASHPMSLWEVPDSWTLSQAATIPCAYATAYVPFPPPEEYIISGLS